MARSGDGSNPGIEMENAVVDAASEQELRGEGERGGDAAPPAAEELPSTRGMIGAGIGIARRATAPGRG